MIKKIIYGFQQRAHIFKKTLDKITPVLQPKVVSNRPNSYVYFGNYSQKVYSGVNGGGITIYNKQKDTFVHRKSIRDPNQTFYPYQVVEDHKKNLWVLSNLYNDVVYNDFINDTYKILPIKKDNKQIKISALFIKYDRRFIDDPVLWIGTNTNGLIKYHISDSTTIFYTHESNNPRSLSSNSVQLIERDSRGLIWLGTLSGLNIINPTTESIYHFYEKDGLPNNAINGIVEDDYGNIWLSTNYGISRVNVVEYENNVRLRFQNFDHTDGLINTEYAVPSFHKDENGIIYFGGTDGIDVIDPTSIKTNPFNPRTLITRIKTEDKELNLPDCTKPLLLDASTEILEFDFVSLNYANHKNSKYSYKLSGFDKDWIYAETNRNARYTNLNPGKYFFEVKTLNSNGIWNKSVAQIHIEIIPPFWKTPSFFALVAFFVFTLVIVFIRRQNANRKYLEYKIDERTLQLKQKNRELHQANKQVQVHTDRIQTINEYLETTLEKLNDTTKFKDSMVEMIAHDIKNPLNTILTLSEDKVSTEGRRTIYYSANQILNLVMNLMETHKYDNGQFTIDRQIHSLLEIVESSLSQVSLLAEQKSVSIKVEIDNGLSVYCDKDIITRVLVNLLTNGIKYSEYNSEIQIEVKVDEKDVILSVTDYGLGIPENKLKDIFSKYTQINKRSLGSVRSSGIGLTFCHIALEAHKKSIWVKSNEEKGTVFSFSLDLSNEVSNYISVLPAQKKKIDSKKLLENHEFEQYLSNLKKLDVYDSSDIILTLNNMKELSGKSVSEWCKKNRNGSLQLGSRNV